MLETDRLILRYWTENDANDLYKYASNEKIGYSTGWPVHKNVYDSLSVIKNILIEPYNYAICLKATGEVIGSFGIILNKNYDIEKIEYSNVENDEVEIGYWIGEEHWGNGYIPEASREVIKYLFQKLNVTKIWCNNYADNKNSGRVKEKLGFKHLKTVENVEEKLIGRVVDLNIGYLTKIEWEKNNIRK